VLPLKQVLPTDQRELLALYSNLSEADRRSLINFGRFLAKQQQTESQGPSDESISSEPLAISRPENESVIKAIRRLSQTYPMLDNNLLIDGTSMLMSAHVLQGRSAEQVIDELELLFEQKYTIFMSGADE
jgi:hypothetical protein